MWTTHGVLEATNAIVNKQQSTFTPQKTAPDILQCSLTNVYTPCYPKQSIY